MANQPVTAHPVTDKQDRQANQPNGAGRRAYPRYEVDCAVMIETISGSMQLQGQISDLSLGGCRVVVDQRYTAGIMVRVEVQFKLRGIAFRIVGVTVGSRAPKCFAIRFLDMPARRREELAGVLAEVAQANAAKASVEAIEAGSASLPPVGFSASAT